MFKKCSKATFIMLLALVMHLFVGQHDSSSALILCWSDDGRVAVEVMQHEHHELQVEPISNATNHLKRCKETEHCQDIVLSLEHEEMLLKSEAEADLTRIIYQSLWAETFTFITPDVPEIRLAHNTFDDFDLQDITAQTQTLKHTILLI